MAKTKGKIASSLHNPEKEVPLTRKIALYRKEDVSGNSGCGYIATGLIFPSGFVIVEWLSVEKSMEFCHSVAQLEKLHSHDGRTEVRYLD
jgi:hypothetical protein